MNPYDVPASVVRTWFKRLDIRSVEPIRPGFSGAIVLRCTDARGERYALKRWPLGTTLQRICEVHHVISQARQFGCQLLPHLVPASTTDTVTLASPGPVPATVLIVEIEGWDGIECWELSVWIEGQTLAFHALPEQVAQGAAAIAEFHRASIGIKPPSFVNDEATRRAGRHVSSPSLVARLRRLEQLQVEVPQALAAPLPEGLGPELSAAIERARRVLRQRWTAIVPELGWELNRRLGVNVVPQYVLRDVHREHILFSPGLFSPGEQAGHDLRARAIIDFDALRLDCPSVDVARWVGSFYDVSGAKHQLLDAAVAGYRQTWRLTDDQILVARTLLQVSHWVNLGNWVTWIVLATRRFVNDELAIASRISEIVDQTESGV